MGTHRLRTILALLQTPGGAPGKIGGSRQEHVDGSWAHIEFVDAS